MNKHKSIVLNIRATTFPRAEWIEESKYLLKIFNNEKKKSYSKKTQKICHIKHRFFRNILRISQKMTKNVQK